MPADAIFERLTRVFREVFQNDKLVVTPASSPADIVGWDSFANATLVVALETEFSIRFRPAELRTLTNAGKIADAITAKAGH